MSVQTEIVLLLKKGKETKWCSYGNEQSALVDRKIYEDQGYEFVSMGPLEIEDGHPVFELEDYPKDKGAMRFAEVFSDIESGKYFIVGTMGGYEISRKDLRRMQTWIKGALKYCGKDPDEKE